MYTENVLNLLNSVTQKLAVTENGVLLIKHYNSLDLKQEIVEEYLGNKKGIKCIYHEFDGSVMAEPYEPFLSSIKDIFYKEYSMTIDEFLDVCCVYELHKSILKSYFETGICKRVDEVLVTEYQYECDRMQENIDNMLKYISAKQKFVFVFNRLNHASESTIRMLLSMINNKKYNHISIIATYNEMNNITGSLSKLWEEYMDYLVRNDSVVEWSYNEN